MRKAGMRAATLRRDKLTLIPKKRMQTAARFALAGLLAVAVVACGRQSPESLMASAKEYLVKGDRNAAVIQLKNLLTKTPDNGEARLLLGEALLDAEDYVSAEKELARALALKQPQEKVVPAYARALLAQGKNQAVVAEVEKYKLFSPPAVAATQTSVGDAFMRLANRSRAREAYAAALAAVPGYPRARLGEAMLAAMEGGVDDALKQVDEIIAADPGLVEARAFRADILLVKGDRDGAKKALEEAITANERFLPARLTLIGLLIDERQFDAAAQLIESTRKTAPRDVRVTYLHASLAFKKGDMDAARQQVDQVLKLLPNHVPSLVLAGAIDLQAERLAAAELGLNKALTRAPNHRAARQLLVQTYLRMGQPARAKEVLQPLLEKGMPQDAKLLLLAGESFLASGDVNSATEFYRAASKAGQAPAVAARTRLGEIALATGDVEQGFRELEAASDLDPGQYQADLAIISGHLRRSEFDKAIEALQTLERKQPKNPLTFQMYGVVYQARQELGAARRNFEKALELQPNYLPAAFNLSILDLTEKRPEDARKRYESMIAQDNRNDQLYLALAVLQFRLGDEVKAIEETLRRGVRANPQSPSARIALINLHLRTGDTKAALTAAQSAVAAMPNDPFVLDVAGVAQESAGEVNQAIETYNKLVALRPRAPEPLYRLAALYLRQKDTSKAIESLRRVQKIAPRERDVVSQLVRVYLAADQPDSALREARELQKREPRLGSGFMLEGDVRMAQRDFAEAQRMYRQALKLDPKANAVAIKLHEALADSGKHAEAESWAKKWTADNPRDAAMPLYLGDRELVAKNLKASAAHYRAVIAIDQNNAQALNNLAWISGELGDPKGMDYAERAVKVAPNSVEFLDTYGVLLMKKGEIDKALQVFERARVLAPSRSDVRLNYAKALTKAGKKNEARRELEALSGVKERFAGSDEIPGLLKAL